MIELATAYVSSLESVIDYSLNNYIKKYVDEKLKEQAEKTYEVISNLVEWNVSKEEFVKLLME